MIHKLVNVMGEDLVARGHLLGYRVATQKWRASILVNKVPKRSCTCA